MGQQHMDIHSGSDSNLESVCNTFTIDTSKACVFIRTAQYSRSLSRESLNTPACSRAPEHHSILSAHLTALDTLESSDENTSFAGE